MRDAVLDVVQNKYGRQNTDVDLHTKYDRQKMIVIIETFIFGSSQPESLFIIFPKHTRMIQTLPYLSKEFKTRLHYFEILAKR